MYFGIIIHPQWLSTANGNAMAAGKKYQYISDRGDFCMIMSAVTKPIELELNFFMWRIHYFIVGTMYRIFGITFVSITSGIFVAKICNMIPHYIPSMHSNMSSSGAFECLNAQKGIIFQSTVDLWVNKIARCLTDIPEHTHFLYRLFSVRWNKGGAMEIFCRFQKVWLV